MRIDKRALVPIAVALGMALGIVLGFGLAGGNNAPMQGRWEKIDQILHYVEQDYVDTVSRSALEEQAITYLLQQLDPHSHYISNRDVSLVNESLEGAFVGIGIQFNFKSDTVYVVKTIANGPADKAGMEAGDQLLEADGIVIAGRHITTDSVMSILKGQADTEVDIKVLRKGSQLDIKVTRGEVSLGSIDAAYLMNDSTVYVRLDRFAKNTYEEFKEAAYPLRSAKVKHFVLDIRGNGGGFLDAAADIADEFLEDNLLITYTEGKARERTEYFATSDGEFEDVKLHVIIDGRTASASEIVAGAVQDHERGDIYGQRSFGKGLVQEQNEWTDGSATRLTVARYYTPNGRSIQRPYQSLASNQAFLDTIGGILPDVELIRDTAGITWLYAEIVHKGLLNEFAYVYRDQEYDRLKLMNFDSFQAEVSDSILLGELKTYLKDQLITVNEAEWKRSSHLIANRLRALVARILFTDNEFYLIHNEQDDAIKTVIERIKKPKSKTPA